MVGRSSGRRGCSTPDATSAPVAAMDRRAPAAFDGVRPPASVTGSSRATCAARVSAARTPVPPGCGPPAVSSSRRVAPAARWARPWDTISPAWGPSAVASAGRWRTFQTSRAAPATRSGDSEPLSWTASGSTAEMMAASSSSVASTVIATMRGPVAKGAAARTRRARSAPSASDRARGVPGTKLRPTASAPARTAARAPSGSVTPQIFTNGRRATLAGSSGGRPAATNDRTVAAGSAERTKASPTRAASKPWARQRPIWRVSRTPDSATTSRSSGTSSRSREAISGSTTSVRRSRLFSPTIRAPLATAASTSPASWASTSGSRPISRASSTRRASASGSCRLASRRTRSAPAARSIGSWIASTTNSFARTGTLTAARTARRSATEPPNQCGSHRTEITLAPPAS